MTQTTPFARLVIFRSTRRTKHCAHTGVGERRSHVPTFETLLARSDKLFLDWDDVVIQTAASSASFPILRICTATAWNVDKHGNVWAPKQTHTMRFNMAICRQNPLKYRLYT